LIVLVTPMLSGDLWRAADNLQPEGLLPVAALTVLPLFTIFLRRIRLELPTTLKEAAAEVANDSNSKLIAADRLVRLVDDEKWTQIRGRVERELSPLFSRGFDSQLQEAVVSGLTKPLGRQLIGRAATTLLGLGIAVTVYLYLLAWALIEKSVAAGWLNERVPVREIDAVIGDFAIPVGPYLLVSGLLGVIATAVLLAFVATEERYARELSTALLRQPLAEGLAVALPYQALRNGPGRGQSVAQRTEGRPRASQRR
jgi:hypothetical protein